MNSQVEAAGTGLAHRKRGQAKSWRDFTSDRNSGGHCRENHRQNNSLNKKGYGCFNLVVTPNHDITEFITEELVRRGVEPTEIGFHSLNQVHKLLMISLIIGQSRRSF